MAGAAEAGDAAGAAGSEAEREYILPTSPEFRDERVDISQGEIEVLEFLRFLADYTGLPVIIDSTNQAIKTQMITIPAPMRDISGDIVVGILKANRFLVTREVLPSGEVVLNVESAGPTPAAVGVDPSPTPIINVTEGKAELLETHVEPGFENVSPDEIATMVFTLKYTEPRDAITSLNNLMGGVKGTARSKAFSIVEVQNSMIVIVTAKFGLLNYIQKLLKIIDVPIREPERIIQIVDVENADADELVSLIQTFLQGRGTSRFGGRTATARTPRPGQPGGTPTTSLTSSADYETNLIADWRTQKIIVETYSERDLEDINMLVRELDTRFDMRRLKTRIYQVRFLKAIEVADDLQILLSGSTYGRSGTAGLGTRSTRTTRSRGVSRVGGRGTGAAATPTPVTPGGAASNAPMPALIVPHEPTNSLIIQAEPEEYAEVLNILEQIDTKRRQVFLEAALVQVTTGSDLTFTIELLAGEPDDESTRLLFESSFGLSGIQLDEFNRTLPDLSDPAAVPPGALSALMHNGKFPALVHFFKTNTDSEVLATPFILADDNQTNVIDILETRFVQLTNTVNTSTTTSQEGEDAGIILEITPTISSQNAVFLELLLEVSAFTGEGTPQVLPPKTTNTITSAVTVPDGEIFVIGGLTREINSRSISKVPILGDIPILGKLFRSESTSKSASNLYIFLRAHVLMHPEFLDGLELTQQADRMVREFAPDLEQLRFEAPQVPLPPEAERDPSAPQRFYREKRSQFPEGYEAPRGPFEMKPGSDASMRPQYRPDDLESPLRNGLDTTRAATSPSPEGAATAPVPRTAPGSLARDATGNLPPGGLESPSRTEPRETTPAPAIPDPARTSIPTDRRTANDEALLRVGLEVDPDGRSWLIPVRPATRSENGVTHNGRNGLSP